MSEQAKILLAGKDWFTEIEAAAYCGVSESQFRSGYRALGLIPKRVMGKKLYSRAALYAAIDRCPEWQPSTRAASPGTSVGQKVANNSADPSARLKPVRLREYAPRKRPN